MFHIGSIDLGAAYISMDVVPLSSSSDFKCEVIRPLRTWVGEVFNKDTYENCITTTVSHWDHDYMPYSDIRDVLDESQYSELKNNSETLRSCAGVSFTSSFRNYADISDYTFVESPLHKFFRENFIEA